jgi:threonine dehydrogenase-like Zn-dependent dehydrogenase
LEFCKKQLGFEHCIDATGDVISKLQEITSGDMPTVVIDATGNLTAMNNGFAYMAHGARYVLVGLQREHISFSHPEFHKREATLMSSRNATKDDFTHVINAIKQGKVQPAKYITHTTSFDGLKENFSMWFVPGSTVVKAVVKMD